MSTNGSIQPASSVYAAVHMFSRSCVNLYMWKNVVLLLLVVSPNDGFLHQLELYHLMGCRVDLSFPAYRKYRLDLLAEQMQKGILTELFVLLCSI